MAIQLNLGNTNSTSTASKDERPQAQFWMNIGFMSENPETGEELFVSLPVGLPLDTMAAMKVSGNNAEWRQLAAAKNALLEQLQQAVQAMEPGAEHTIPGLTVQVRRVNSETGEDSSNANPHMVKLAGLKLA